MTRMTFSSALVIVRALGFTLSKRDGEYRLNPKGGTESSAYYTDDLTDAVSTAQNWR